VFDTNFGKCGPIFKILYQLIRRKILYVHITKISTSPAVCCYTTLWKLKIKMLVNLHVGHNLHNVYNIRSVAFKERRQCEDNRGEKKSPWCTNVQLSLNNVQLLIRDVIWQTIQELSYRKQIARQLRTQYVDLEIMTLKSTSTVTQGHWKRYHWVDHTRLTVELLDIEYYRDIEMWVSVAVCKIFSVKEWRDLENQILGRSTSLKIAPCVVGIAR